MGFDLNPSSLRHQTSVLLLYGRLLYPSPPSLIRFGLESEPQNPTIPGSQSSVWKMAAAPAPIVHLLCLSLYCCIMPYYSTSCYYYMISCYNMIYDIILGYAVLCNVMLHYITLHHYVLLQRIIVYTILCYVILYYYI